MPSSPNQNITHAIHCQQASQAECDRPPAPLHQIELDGVKKAIAVLQAHIDTLEADAAIDNYQDDPHRISMVVGYECAIDLIRKALLS